MHNNYFILYWELQSRGGWYIHKKYNADEKNKAHSYVKDQYNLFGAFPGSINLFYGNDYGVKKRIEELNKSKP